jgi:hypothetical protein
MLKIVCFFFVALVLAGQLASARLQRGLGVLPPVILLTDPSGVNLLLDPSGTNLLVTP